MFCSVVIASVLCVLQEGYLRFAALVPKKGERVKLQVAAGQLFGAARRDYPATPEKDAAVGKRQFDGRLRAWRRMLHQWDATSTEKSVVTDKESGAKASVAFAQCDAAAEVKAARAQAIKSLAGVPSASS